MVDTPIGQRREGMSTLFEVIAWMAFCAARGPYLLIAAVAKSYRVWPGTASVSQVGGEAVALAVSLALPSLLAIALVEVCATLAQRLETSARMPFDARSLALALRPVVVMLLCVASLAAFTESVANATRAILP
jgi:flagellar biosynthesis protein FliR